AFGVSCRISTTVPSCHLSCCAMPLITRVSLLFPGVAVVVIAERLPESRVVFPDKFEAAQPFRAFPKIEVRHEQAGRAAVHGLERLAIVLVNDPRFSSADVGERQVRRVAAVAKGDEITDRRLGGEVNAREQRVERDARPESVEL